MKQPTNGNGKAGLSFAPTLSTEKKATAISCLQTAEELLMKGIQPIPVPLGSKSPALSNWQNMKLTKEQLPDYFAGKSNIGVLLGEPSGGLVDIDLDCPEALLFRDLLPDTGMSHGRPGNLKSHFFYIATGELPKTKKYSDIKIDGKEVCIIEFRSTGAQTVVPPSMHPSGEIYEWVSFKEPAKVSGGKLFNDVGQMAASALLVRHYFAKGSRNDATLALAGMLAKAGMGDSDAEYFIERVAKAANDEEWKDRKKAVAYTRKRINSKKPFMAVKKLREYLGKKVVDKLIDFLNPHSDLDAHEKGFERKLTHLELAERAIEQYGGKVLNVENQLRAYANGHWPVIDEQGEMRRIISDIDRPNTSAHRTSNAIHTLEDITGGEGSSQNHNLLCLINGTLDLFSYELLDHSPDHHLLHQLPIKWNPDAICSLWLQTLEEIFDGDEDKEEKIRLLQMWFGYCLTTDVSQHKFLWLIGMGANGKSLILEILTLIIGAHNVSHAMISRLDRAFIRAELQGKLVNISPEMKAEDTLKDSYLKAIVAGDRIEAERKYERSFSFTPFVKIVAATNHLPKLLDLSDGFKRRAIILSFNRTFSEKEQDKKRIEKLKGELAGILLWALEGLKMLRHENEFIIPLSSIELLGDYIKDSNPVALFVEEALIPDDKGVLTTTDINSLFQDWCKLRGFKTMNITTLGQRLTELGIKKRSSNGKKYWCLKWTNEKVTLLNMKV